MSRIARALALIALLVGLQANAAVTLNGYSLSGGADANTVAATSSATSFSSSALTIASGTNRLLIVSLNCGNQVNPTGFSVTWNSVALTAVPSGFDDKITEMVGLYYLVSPATGNHTLAGSWTGADDCYVGAIVFDGAGSVDNAVTSASTADLTISVTGTSDGATVASHIRNGGVPTGGGSGNTLFWDYDANAPGGGGAYRIGLNGTNAFDFNSGSLGTARATAGVHIAAFVAAATLSAPTPSGTLGTQTTATIGATTDTTTGTFYAVVDTSGNLSGVTAAQIKAGQKASGAAALASCNASVTTTTPSCGVTGLTANTAYAYSAIQNSAGGDSNIVSGTLTTAAATSAVPLFTHHLEQQTVQ